MGNAGSVARAPFRVGPRGDERQALRHGRLSAELVSSRIVSVYDIATNTWTYGPLLPLPNNHGIAASVNGKIYLIGGQLNADHPPGTNSYVNTVYELDLVVGEWVTKAPMLTERRRGGRCARRQDLRGRWTTAARVQLRRLRPGGQ